MTISSLPYPIARIWRRSQNATDARNAHDNAWSAWEASVKLCVIATPEAHRAELARGSIGLWVRAMVTPEIRTGQAALLALHALLTARLSDDEVPQPTRSSVGAREIIDALPGYRNRVLGHGAVRSPRFYLTAADILLEGLEEAWRRGFFLTAGQRLVYVAGVRRDAGGQFLAEMYNLGSEVPDLLDREGTRVPDDVLAERLYLQRDHDYLPLHPLLLFQFDRQATCFFNGLKRGGAEFLDFASGALLAGDALRQLHPGIEQDIRTALGTTADDAPHTEPAPPPDRNDIGDYRIVGQLGEGGMGVVYLAVQKSLDRLVALKMLPLARLGDLVAQSRFEREMRALACCEHKNVVKILDSGTARGTPFYAMEYVDGVDLARVATALRTTGSFDQALASETQSIHARHKEQFGNLPYLRRTPSGALSGGDDRPTAIARVIRDAARGLHHLHQLGIIHRDISPANIMVTVADRRAVIMDLGLAALGDQPASVSRVTRVLGTPLYTAPERLIERGASRDVRIDVYSLGAVLYELLCDRPMFDAEDEKRLQHQILWTDPTPPHRVRRDCPQDLSIITRKAIAKDPAQRYASAEDLAADLDAFLAGRAIGARPPSFAYQLGLLARRNRLACAIAATSLLVMIGLTGWALIEGNTARAKERELRTTLVSLRQLSDQGSIAQRIGGFKQLWPPRPEKTDAIVHWLVAARAVVANQPMHHAALAQLRSEGTPVAPGDPDPRIDALEERLAMLREHIESHRKQSPDAEPIDPAELQRRVADDEALLAFWETRLDSMRSQDEICRAEDTTYDFAGNAELRWQHDQLRDLNAALRDFQADDRHACTIAGVEHCMALLHDLDRATRSGADAIRAWQEARDAIGNIPNYQGLDLQPQFGLFPLGPDPESGLWEFWHVQTGERPERDPLSGQWIITGDTGIVLVLIPGGTATLGSQSDDPEGPYYFHQPGRSEELQRVALSPFFLSKYEMTRGQWLRLTGDDPSDSAFSRPCESGFEYAVDMASWGACTRALAWSDLILPTEAQWEYACRAGTSSPWACSKDGLPLHANVRDQAFVESRFGSAPGESLGDEGYDGHAGPAPVGSFLPNRWGLHDMHGNLWERCRDSGSRPPRPGDGERSIAAQMKGLRGGSFYTTSWDARSASRAADAAETADNTMGVRPARSIE